MAPPAGPATAATAICLAALGGLRFWAPWASAPAAGGKPPDSEHAPDDTLMAAQDAPAADALLGADRPVVEAPTAAQSSPGWAEEAGWFEGLTAAHLLSGAVLADLLLFGMIVTCRWRCRRAGGRSLGAEGGKFEVLDSGTKAEAAAIIEPAKEEVACDPAPAAPPAGGPRLEAEDTVTRLPSLSGIVTRLPSLSGIARRASEGGLAFTSCMSEPLLGDAMDAHEFFAKVPLLKGFPERELRRLARACQVREYLPSEEVIRQGEPGEEFFVIREGRAKVFVAKGNEKPHEAVRTLEAGDFFGERALMHECPRAATVVADTAMKALVISRQKFKELGLHDQLGVRERKVVRGGAFAVPKMEPTPKTPEERENIAKALMNNQNLQMMVTLNKQRVNDMIDICWKQQAKQGQVIVKESDAADYFYVIQEGQFQLHKKASVEDDKGLSHEYRQMLSASLNRLGPGGSFGEMALLCMAPRAASVTALTDGTLWTFDRDSFKRILMQNSKAETDKYCEILKEVTALRCLLADERECLAAALTDLMYNQDDLIIEQGHLGHTLYILFNGEVAVIQDGKEVNRLATSPGTPPQVFGETALMKDGPRTATIKVTSTRANVLILDRDTFDTVLSPLEDIRAEARKGLRVSAVSRTRTRTQSYSAEAEMNREHISQDDLTRLGVLGAGGFGTVVLCGHKTKKDMTFALKCISKGYIVNNGLKTAVMTEKQILWLCNSPFVIKIYATYCSDQELFMLLEVALGGELHTVYQRKDLYGSHADVRFHTACVGLALQHLHSLRVVYRDLKPENIMLDAGGYAKLTDMGLAKVCPGVTFTVCGTPDYFAPELITSKGHGLPLDWWTLGILIFELLAGAPPFEAPDPMETYRRILQGVSFQFPVKCQGHAENLIRALLEKKPRRRLPVLPGGFTNLETHTWYEKTDWQGLRRGKVTPPYRPMVKNPQDRSNFIIPKETAPVEPYQDDGSGWDRDFAAQ